MKEIHPCSVSDSREKGRQPAVAEPAVAAGSTVVCKGVDFDETKGRSKNVKGAEAAAAEAKNMSLS